MVTPEHIGRYVGLQLIGVGGFGNVYRATDSDNGSLVAIKVLNQEFSLDLAWVTRFQQEAGFMAQIGDHPNVVKVFDLQQEGDTFYIVMEYYPGGNLATLINTEQRLNHRAAVGMVLQIAAGLSAAHAAGVVHRDIKPENILLDEDEVCKISDFGIAASTDRSIYTRIGTLYYMAPEQALGRRTDARADIYSLGVTLYQMLTGALPVELEQTERPPDPRGIYQDIPDRLVEILYRAIEFDADDRYQNIDDLVADLETYEVTPASTVKIEAIQTDILETETSEVPRSSAPLMEELPEELVGAEDSEVSLAQVPDNENIPEENLDLEGSPDSAQAVEEAQEGTIGSVPLRAVEIGPDPGYSDVPDTTDEPGGMVHRLSGTLLLGSIAALLVLIGVIFALVLFSSGPDLRVSGTVPPSSGISLENASGSIIAFLPEGAAPIGSLLSIEEVSPQSLPPLPAGVSPTKHAFDVSLVSEGGDKVQLSESLMVSVVFDDSEIEAAGGDVDRFVIGHFREESSVWEQLATGVEWEERRAWAFVDSLSPFVLLIREQSPSQPGVEPSPTSTVTLMPLGRTR